MSPSKKFRSKKVKSKFLLLMLPDKKLLIQVNRQRDRQNYIFKCEIFLIILRFCFFFLLAIYFFFNPIECFQHTDGRNDRYNQLFLNKANTYVQISIETIFLDENISGFYSHFKHFCFPESFEYKELRFSKTFRIKIPSRKKLSANSVLRNHTRKRLGSYNFKFFNIYSQINGQPVCTSTVKIQMTSLLSTNALNSNI